MFNLNDEQKEKLRAEEIFRQEIRQEIESKANKSFLSFLNSPLGIWLLSTVLVGFLSFSYKTWQDSIRTKNLNKESASIVIDEGNFRIRQLDKAIENAMNHFELVTSHQEKNGSIMGSDFRNFIESAKLVTVTIDRGGIVNIPQSGDLPTWIGSSGYGVSHLPYKRAYKKTQFSSDSLLDLGSQLLRLSNVDKSELSKLEVSIDELDDIYAFKFEEILSDWRMRHQASGKYKEIYHDAYKVYKVSITDYGDEIATIGEWIKTVKSRWQAVKSNKIIEPMS
ncbi:hypothetical protein [Vibrio atypicus]|uniref:hypothetical protein n=1 Tax=Vibrio atypicus TaxID=558271 RepID=UPI003735D181|nr:hypothetical protein [Vibrio parahaemolyticus]